MFPNSKIETALHLLSLSTLGLEILHEFLVVALGIPLFELHHLSLLLNVILLLDVVKEIVDHLDDAGRLLALGLVCEVGLGKRRGCCLNESNA